MSDWATIFENENGEVMVTISMDKLAIIKDELGALQAKCERYEKTLKEISEFSDQEPDSTLRYDYYDADVAAKMAREALNHTEENKPFSVKDGIVTINQDCMVEAKGKKV